MISVWLFTAFAIQNWKNKQNIMISLKSKTSDIDQSDENDEEQEIKLES